MRIHRFVTNIFDNRFGFQIVYETSDVSQWIHRMGECGGNFSTPNGIFTSPSYPEKYSNRADCYYHISQPTGSNITLNFHTLDIEPGTSCQYDYLEIRDGAEQDSPLVGKLCGDEIPTPIQSSQNNLWMK